MSLPVADPKGEPPISVFHCWLVRGSLFIELGSSEDLGKGGGETLALL